MFRTVVLVGDHSSRELRDKLSGIVQLVVGLNRGTKDKLSRFVQLEAVLLVVGLNRDTKDRLSLVVQLVVVGHS